MRGALPELGIGGRIGVNTGGWGYEDLATVLEDARRIDDALERALVLWERKRCLPLVRRVRDQIDSLGRAKASRPGATRTRRRSRYMPIA